MNLLTFSPWHLTPMEKSTHRVTKVTSSLRQKTQEPICCPRGTALVAAFSPRLQVLNLSAEKSNAPVRTATHPIAMMMNPIQHASQSSFFQRSDQLVFFVSPISKKFWFYTYRRP